MSFKDHFSGHAGCYEAYRPTYPDALFGYLASMVPGHAMAWDCATGNGQAALPLARHFRTVVATDPSRNQLGQARRQDSILYAAARAERTPIQRGSVDLVTVAQALHWLDLPRFYAEVERVCRPGGVCAVWCYELHQIDARIDALVDHLYHDVVGRFWPPERRFVEEGYRTLPFPFALTAVPQFEMSARWDLPRLLGYLSSWSATQRYRARHGSDPLDVLRPELEAAWGDPGQFREVVWPLHVRVGRVDGNC